MDSKIKQKFVPFLLVSLSLFFHSCKENKWADWKVQNQIWLEQKAQEADVKKTSDGLLYKIIADPTPQDAQPNITSTIVCDYRVKLINGYVVEYQGSTFGGIKSATIPLSNTIQGFAEGCHLIHNNGDIELYIPYWLGYDYQKVIDKEEYEAEGYGTEGTQAYIPPYSTLIYEIHICSVTGE